MSGRPYAWIRRCVASTAAALFLGAAAQAQSVEDGRGYFATNCTSCHAVPPVAAAPPGSYKLDVSLSSWLTDSGTAEQNISTFKTRLGVAGNGLGQGSDAMRTLAALPTDPANVHAYLLAVRDGVRTPTSSLPTAYADTALTRSSARDFTFTVTNYRRDAMTLSAKVTTTDSPTSALSPDFRVVSIAPTTCGSADLTTGAPSVCTVKVSTLFAPDRSVSSEPGLREARLFVVSSWSSDPTTSTSSIPISAIALDTFSVATPDGWSFVISGGSTSVTKTATITDNLGDELRACLADGAAPNGVANFSLAVGASAPSTCVTLPATVGPRAPTFNVSFTPGATTTPLNARLIVQRWASGSSTGDERSIELRGNGPVIQIMGGLLFRNVSIEVDSASPSSESLTVQSRGVEALTFTGPTPFTIAAGQVELVSGQESCTAVARSASIEDYELAPGGCTARTGLDAWSGVASPATECPLTVRFTPRAPGLRCGVLTILSNARTQTIVLEGRGFIGPTAFVLQGAEQARSGTLLDFTTQRVPPPPGAPYLPQRLTLRNGGTQGNLDVLLPSADAVAGFRIERTGACGVVAPFGNGTTGPQCDIAVSFTPTELRSYAGSFFDIRTRAEGSAGEYTVFRVNLAGVGSDTAPALTWETTDGRTLSSFGDFAKDASLGCTAPGAVCERRAVLRNGGPGSVRVDFVNVIGQDSGSWSARLNPPCAAGAFVPVRGSCDVVITFTPTTAGTKSAVLQLVSTGNGPEALRLDGSYSAPAQSPELLVVQAAAFENTRAGSRSGPVEFAVTNPGDHPIDVRGWTVTGPFSVVSTTCPAFPFVLQGHNSCTVTLTFDPANSGAATGTFDVLSSMPSPTTATLLATADAAADLSSGGCSIAEGETPADPTLGMLTFLALVALWYRREARRRDQPVVRDRRLRR